jgi:hypothetical protein
VLAAAVKVGTPFRSRQPDGGLPAGSSGNGRLGSFNAATWVVCHDMRACGQPHPAANVIASC